MSIHVPLVEVAPSFAPGFTAVRAWPSLHALLHEPSTGLPRTGTKVPPPIVIHDFGSFSPCSHRKEVSRNRRRS